MRFLPAPKVGKVWFSCRVRFAHYSDDDSTYLMETCSYLFRGPRDYDAAMSRALEVGREREKIFRNSNGGMARVAMVEVEALDMIDRIFDGVEVASIWSDDLSQCPYSLDHHFNPENSRPTRSL